MGLRRNASTFLLVAVPFALITGYLETIFYLNFTDEYDWGNYAQAVASSVHGLPMLIMSQPWYVQGFPHVLQPASFLSLYAAFDLYLLTPAYALFGSPLILAYAQVLAIVVSSVPVYLLAREKTKTPATASLFLFGYLFNPLIFFTTINGFHVETFLLPGLNWFLYLGYHGRVKLSAIPAAFACLATFIAVPLLVSAAIWLFIQRKIRWYSAFAFSALPLAYLFFSQDVLPYLLLPHNLPSTGATLSGNWPYFHPTSIADIPIALAMHLGSIWPSLASLWQFKATWLFLLFSGTAALSIFVPSSAVMMLPWLLPAMTTSYIGYVSPYDFYVSFIAYAVFIPSVLGYARLTRSLRPVARGIVTLALAMFILVGTFMVPVLAYVPGTLNTSVTPGDIQAEGVLHALESNQSVLITTPDVFLHVANDMNAYQVFEPQVPLAGDQDLTLVRSRTWQYVIITPGSNNVYDSSTSSFLMRYVIDEGNYSLAWQGDTSQGVLQVWALNGAGQRP